jgi:hypothetical protein
MDRTGGIPGTALIHLGLGKSTRWPIWFHPLADALGADRGEGGGS